MGQTENKSVKGEKQGTELRSELLQPAGERMLWFESIQFDSLPKHYNNTSYRNKIETRGPIHNIPCQRWYSKLLTM